MRRARNTLRRHLLDPRPAIVLDVDDTALSTYGCMKAADFDRDGVRNAVEVQSKTIPWLSDSDRDGTSDGEQDLDGDGCEREQRNRSLRKLHAHPPSCPRVVASGPTMQARLGLLRVR